MDARDEGKLVEGKRVVFLGSSGPRLELRPTPEQTREESAKAQAAVLGAAARDGAPFCEDCERARRELERRARG